MQQHTKVYYTFFGYAECDFVPCESCGNKAVDIHHIKPRSLCTKEERDQIENLIALCRYCHDAAHAYVYSREFLTNLHNQKLAKQKGQTI